MLNALLDLDPHVELSDGRRLRIADDAHWVTMLKCSQALADTETPHDTKVLGVLTMFYDAITVENLVEYAPFFEELAFSMYFVLSYGNMDTEHSSKKPIVDFEKDIRLILEGISANHGEIRRGYLHWWTFLDYFHGIKDCTFSTVAGIRWKQANGKKLEKWEQEFFKNNRTMVRLE